MKKYYVLYDFEDRPILYFETLKEFSEKLGYSYEYLKQEFCKNKNFDYIDLFIQRYNYKLYRFID